MNDKEVIAKQANELFNRGQKIMELEESIRSLKDNFHLVLKQNKELEILITSLREERQKLLEEIEDFKKNVVSISKKIKNKEKFINEKSA